MMLLHVYIKDLIFLVIKPQVWGKRPRMSTLKKEIKYENDFFQQKDCDIHNKRPFFVYEMKLPKSGKSL